MFLRFETRAECGAGAADGDRRGGGGGDARNGKFHAGFAGAERAGGRDGPLAAGRSPAAAQSAGAAPRAPAGERDARRGGGRRGFRGGAWIRARQSDRRDIHGAAAAAEDRRHRAFAGVRFRGAAGRDAAGQSPLRGLLDERARAFASPWTSTAPSTTCSSIWRPAQNQAPVHGGARSRCWRRTARWVAYGRKDHASAMRLDDELRVLRGLSVAFPAVFLSIAAFMSSAVLTRLDSPAARADRAAQGVRLFVARSRLALSEVRLRHRGARHAARRRASGCWLGRNVVNVYHRFFRFPTLDFHPDVGDVRRSRFAVSSGAAFLGDARRGAAGGAAAAGGGDASRAARGIQALAARTRRPRASGHHHFSHGAAQSRAQAVAGHSSPRSASRWPPASRSSPARCATASITCSPSSGMSRSGRMSPPSLIEPGSARGALRTCAICPA